MTRASDGTQVMLAELRGDAYPPTDAGLERAARVLVPGVDTAQCVSYVPGRAVLWVTLRRPWWSYFTFGWYWRRARERVYEIVNAYGAAGVTYEVQVD